MIRPIRGVPRIGRIRCGDDDCCDGPSPWWDVLAALVGGLAPIAATAAITKWWPELLEPTSEPVHDEDDSVEEDDRRH